MSLPFADAPALTTISRLNIRFTQVQRLLGGPRGSKRPRTAREIPESDAVYIMPLSIGKRPWLPLAWLCRLLGCYYLDMEARLDTLQSPRQCDYFAVEIHIQFICFDLDKATDLKWG
jgi:hypothetical protein